MTKDRDLRSPDRDPDEEAFLAQWGSQIMAHRARSAACPSLAQVRAAAAGVLPDKMQAEVSTHVAGCRTCAVLAAEDMEEARPTPEQEAAILARVLRNKPGRAPSILGRRMLVPVALAAGVLVLVSIWTSLRQPREMPPSAGTVAAARKPEAVTARASVFVLEKLAAPAPALPVLVWRGEPERDDDRAAADLSAALEPYRSNDYATAVQRLTDLAVKYPRSADAHLYAGISRLLLGDAPASIAPLKEAARQADRSRRQDAAWYLALAYHQMGEKDLAAASLRPLCEGTGSYASKACAGLRELGVAAGPR